MPKYFLYAAVALLLFTLSCCFTADPVIRLNLDNENKAVIMGDEYVKAEDGDIEAIASFMEEYAGMYVFDISIANYTDTVVRVDPKNFYYIEEGKTEMALRKIKNYARNPEKEILDYRKAGNRERAFYASGQAANMALSLLNFAANVSTLGKDKTDEERAEEEAQTEYVASQWEETEMYHMYAEEMIESGMKQWSIDAMRVTDLPSGYALRGLVYFPTHLYAKRVIINLPVGSANIKLAYDQKKY